MQGSVITAVSYIIWMFDWVAKLKTTILQYIYTYILWHKRNNNEEHCPLYLFFFFIILGNKRCISTYVWPDLTHVIIYALFIEIKRAIKFSGKAVSQNRLLKKYVLSVIKLRTIELR